LLAARAIVYINPEEWTMKRVVAVLAVLALACFVCVSVSEAKGKGGGKAKSPEDAFKAMDKEGKGVVAEAQYLEYSKANQKTYDEAKAKKAFQKMAPDGKLTLKAYQDYAEQQKKKAEEKKKKQ
jgi:Ca2+-binding EF-hand superfamily protein